MKKRLVKCVPTQEGTLKGTKEAPLGIPHKAKCQSEASYAEESTLYSTVNTGDGLVVPTQKKNNK